MDYDVIDEALDVVVLVEEAAQALTDYDVLEVARSIAATYWALDETYEVLGQMYRRQKEGQ